VDAMLEVAITKKAQTVVLGSRKFVLDDSKMDSNCSWTIPLEFTVASDNDGVFEFPIWLIEGSMGIVIRNMTLAKQ
jgi:hypothetical protein